jgi:hypothetical protein
VLTAAPYPTEQLDPMSLGHLVLTPGKRRNMAYVRDLLVASSCADCGEARVTVLEFDHIGTKNAKCH